MATSVAIVGAGIGGLTAALALKQKGFNVSVYEAAPAIKPVGAGIVMANNAMQIFKKLGIHQQIELAGNKVSTMAIVDAQKRFISEMKPEKFERHFGVFNVAIHRADLQHILATAFGFENIFLSKRLSRITEIQQLIFEDGSTTTADVVIGADGIKSVVRQHILKNTIIRDSGQVCWRGICEVAIAAQEQHTALEAWGSGKRFGFVKLGGGKVYWYAVVDRGKVREQTDIAGLFSEFHPDFISMIRNTTTDNLHFGDITDLKPLQKWSMGNICLLGDAAHATTPNLGQGACQAVEDAYTLGEVLGADITPAIAFKEYEQLRMKKANTIVTRSRLLGKFAHADTALGTWCRNIIMRLTPVNAGEKQLDWLFDIDYVAKELKKRK